MKYHRMIIIEIDIPFFSNRLWFVLNGKIKGSDNQLFFFFTFLSFHNIQNMKMFFIKKYALS